MINSFLSFYFTSNLTWSLQTGSTIKKKHTYTFTFRHPKRFDMSTSYSVTSHTLQKVFWQYSSQPGTAPALLMTTRTCTESGEHCLVHERLTTSFHPVIFTVHCIRKAGSIKDGCHPSISPFNLLGKCTGAWMCRHSDLIASSSHLNQTSLTLIHWRQSHMCAFLTLPQLVIPLLHLINFCITSDCTI